MRGNGTGGSKKKREEQAPAEGEREMKRREKYVPKKETPRMKANEKTPTEGGQIEKNGGLEWPVEWGGGEIRFLKRESYAQGGLRER